MSHPPLLHSYKRYQTLRSGHIKALPVVILMPHGACNCRCVMCDIWKGNRTATQLDERDVAGLLSSLKKLDTQLVVMSGGEALLHPGFFRLCEILKTLPVRICLLSTGLTLQKHAASLVKWVDEIILSLDGDEETHDRIRNVRGAFRKLTEGIRAVRDVRPGFRVSGRSVIHQLNFRKWPAIVDAAREIGLDSVSFLPADVTSQAFNRAVPWNMDQQRSILPSEEDLPDFKAMTQKIVAEYQAEFQTHFIVESPSKIAGIYQYYAAFYGRTFFPEIKCNAPFVSAVLEADGTVRPCFFHPALGNFRTGSLESVLNSAKAVGFRKSLDVNSDSTCSRCVCHLHLGILQSI